MERRFLPSLIDNEGRTGAFATKWAGWRNPRERARRITRRINISHPSNAWSLEPGGTGCYALLYCASPESLYVCYIGVSGDLRSEITKRIREFGIEEALFPFTAVYIPNLKLAAAYEDDLIRYYCPPWNTRFSRQPMRG